MEHSTNDNGIFRIEVDETCKNTMLEMARWTKFLGILGFIFLAIILLACIGVAASFSTLSGQYGELLGSMGAAGFIFIYLFTAAIVFYPTYALYRYSVTIKKAVLASNQQLFNNAVRYLKNMFKYQAILAITIIAVYGVLILVIGIGMGMKQ